MSGQQQEGLVSLRDGQVLDQCPCAQHGQQGLDTVKEQLLTGRQLRVVGQGVLQLCQAVGSQ